MKCAIAFYAIFISLCFCICESALRTYYVEDLCDGYYKKDVTLRLRSGHSGILASIPTESSTTECTIRLKPDYGSVLLSFYAYSLDTEDQLILEDSNNFKIALLGQAEFLDERKTFASDGTLTIRYVRDVNSTLGRRSRLKFQFVFTQFREYPCDINEFQCKNQRCISKNLVCDRHNHCGDNSDQEKCGASDDHQKVVVSVKKTNVWMISVYVCSALLGIVIIAFVAVLISGAIKRNKKNNKKGALPVVATSVPPAPSAPEMPPSFFNRIRQSFRRPNSNTQTQTASTQSAPEEPKSEKYEVPSMYPQISSSPNYPGVENPEFKPDD